MPQNNLFCPVVCRRYAVKARRNRNLGRIAGRLILDLVIPVEAHCPSSTVMPLLTRYIIFYEACTHAITFHRPKK